MMITWRGSYTAYTAGTQCLASATVVLDAGENCPQPDSCLRVAPHCGGRSRSTPESYVGGAPELISEVCASSASYDLHEKLEAYQRNGVQEHVGWRVEERAIDWVVVSDGGFHRLRG